MATVAFTPYLERYLAVPTRPVEAASVRGALAQVFTDNPRLESYLLDDQGALRKHVMVFVDGRAAGLDDELAPSSEIFVMQALSGG